jgi:hypothetical protein
VVISQGGLSMIATAAQFPELSQKVSNPLGTAKVMTQQCAHLGDCLEALHARTSRLVQTPPSNSANAYFRGGCGNCGPSDIAYDNEVLLEPIFTALPAMENLVSIIIPFSQPITITSALGLGLQNRWVPDET